MARRKKRMKLPNGFGSIKYLGSGRRNPYAAYPPVTEWTEKGPVTPKALAYTETWEDSYEVLTAYNLEKKGRIKVSGDFYIDRSPTFAELYEKFYEEKFFNSGKVLSKSTMYSIQASFKNCSAIHDIQIRQIKYEDLQKIINDCELRHASLEIIINFLHQIYKYAMKYEIVEKDYSTYLYIPIPDDDESGEPFSDEELEILWNNKDNYIIGMIIIMCYSGFRIEAYRKIDVNITQQYFQGGVKTVHSKDRIVPIHPAILPLVKNRCSRDSEKVNLLNTTQQQFRNSMTAELSSLGISHTLSGKKHTPHDCRHTFSRLCEKYKVNENDRKRMLGHSFANDITNAKYGHRTVQDLMAEIIKIETPT